MKSWASALLCLVAITAAGCGEKVKHQEVLRGRWDLESRKLADGSELTPPAIAGVLEWLPLAEDRAYATVVLSHGEDDVSITGALYELGSGSFVRNEYVRMGAGYTMTPWSSDSIPTKSEGSYSSGIDMATLEHADGSRFLYGKDELTVTRKDGGVDRWKRAADLKGLLAD